jgi:parallel beta-helix repeat protein
VTAPAADGADPVLARREPEIKLRRRRSGNLARLFERKVIRSATCALLALAVVLGMAPQPPALATSPATLYVDGSNPNCSNTGTGTQSLPFCTIGGAAGKVVAGQTVQVAGGTYTEKVTISQSGTSSAPIVFTAAPGATVTVTGQPNGFVLSGRSWVTINGFSVAHTSDYGINISSSSSITISNNHVSYSGSQVSGLTRGGIRLSGSTDSLIVGNTSDHNTYAGIMVVGGSTRNEVRGNTTFNNAQGFERAAPGIRLYASPGNVVDNNSSHDNEDSGIEAYPGSNDSLIYNNVTYNNGDHGIDDYGTTGQRVIGNTVYDNVTAGINLEGSSTGGTIENNICVDNGISSPRTHSDIRVENGSTAGTVVDHNVVYLTTPDTLLIWSSVSYKTLAAFQTASGQMLNGINADPKWRNPASADFHLTAGSQAIDSADSGVSGWPATDAEGNSRYDEPNTPNTGVGLRTYDDQGAYEVQPASGDQPPRALLSVSPSSGTAPLLVSADASGSSDTDATPIASYSFDFGDGSGPTGPQTGATASHSYSSPGSYTVTVTVQDSAGLSSSASAQLTVSTNLVTNAGFETDLSGWSTSGSDANVTLTRVAGGHTGGWAAQLLNAGSKAAKIVLDDSPNWVSTTSAASYVGSMWVRSDTSGATLTLTFREYVGSTLVRTTTKSVTLTASWAPVSLTHATSSPGASTLNFSASIKTGPRTGFYADDIAIYSP